MSESVATPAAESATPRSDPQAFQLRGEPPRVMRLSRKALAVVGVAVGLGIGGSLIYALQPAGEKAAQELYNTESNGAAENIASGPRDYAQVPRLGPPLPGDLGGRLSRRSSAARTCRSRRLAPSQRNQIRALRRPRPRASGSAKSATPPA